MSQNSDNKPEPADAPAEVILDGDRRKVLAAGLAAVPLLVTLAARPAFAQDDYSVYGSPEGVEDTGEDTGGGGKGGGKKGK